MVNTFHVKGKFMMGSSLQEFAKDIKATKKDNALEKLYTDLGSKHGVRRKNIMIEEVRVD